MEKLKKTAIKNLLDDSERKGECEREKDLGANESAKVRMRKGSMKMRTREGD